MKSKTFNVNNAYAVAKTILFAVLVVFCFAVLLFLQTRSKINDPFEFATYDQWDGTVAASFASGDGSQATPYEISSGKELAYFKSLLDGSNYTNYNNLYYKLTNNIDMNNYVFETIHNLFSGNFDGNGYSIANLSLSGYIANNDYYGGLFSILDNAIVKNLNIKNATLIVNNSYYSGVYVGTIAATSSNTVLSNIGVYNSNFTSNNISDIGGIIGNATNNTNISVCLTHVNATASNGSNIGSIVGNSDATIIDSVLFYENGINAVVGTTTSYTTFTDVYSFNQNVIYTYEYDQANDEYDRINANTTLANLSSTMTTKINSEFIWRIDEEYIRFDNTSNVALLTGQTPATPITGGHASGIDGSILYVNDFVSDYNYYRGLNYSSSSNGILPTQNNKNLYNDYNLIQVVMTYSSADINNPNLKGYVSDIELQDTYVYYKMYEVKNNGTSNLNDDYVEIELIDNPFVNRPTDMGFNGWTTNYQNAKISYDKDYYTRIIKIPVTYNAADKPNQIQITLHASWTEAKVGYTGSNMATAFASFDSAGLHELMSTKDVYNYPDLTSYYVRVRLNYGETCNGCYSSSNAYSAAYTCNSSTCDRYYKASDYDANTQYYYYQNRRMNATTVASPTLVSSTSISRFNSSMNMAGYFLPVDYNNGQTYPTGYYDIDGNILDGGTCNSNTCTFYHLIQYQDNVRYNSNNTYYYLATRDTNIAVLSGNVNSKPYSTKPFTFTAFHNGTNNVDNYYFDIRNTFFHCQNDTTVENIQFYSDRTLASGVVAQNNTNRARYLYGNWHNVKLGRGITTRDEGDVSLDIYLGGGNTSTGTSSNPTKYKLMVESGLYNSGSLSNGYVNDNNDEYIEARAIYGNDYDRATLKNSNLIVQGSASGAWGGRIWAGSNFGIALDSVYKSGTLGASQSDNTAGAYVGSRHSGTNYSAARGIVEGGFIYSLIGGPQVDASREPYNYLYLYLKGGTVTIITAGAGSVATFGNRIVQMTGGIIENSILGGSNASGGAAGTGTLKGSTYIYVGGNALVGSDHFMQSNIWKFQVEPGSVFGIGNGNPNISTVGSAANSYIIIADEAIIRKNVYGGGNYGAVGISSNSPENETNIKIIGGHINGSVYGGGNNNGSGSSDQHSTVNLTVSGGQIDGSVYGGSRQKGTIYGDVYVNIYGGSIGESVYGGGQGGHAANSTGGTYVTGNVDVMVGNPNIATTPTIGMNTNGGSIYGGSALGTVNNDEGTSGASDKNTRVILNKGTISGNIFGGGQGGTYIPYVCGTIGVYVNSGTYTNIYGANEAKGIPDNDINVYLDGGTVTNVFGGGKNAGALTTNVYLQGGTATNIFGGSDTTGVVTSSNVVATDGTVTNIYGGNNAGGSTTNASVNIEKDVNEALNITNVYGGGLNAHVTGNTYVDITNSTINGNLFAGGDSGNVGNTANLSITGSTIRGNAYGGGNAATVNSAALDILNSDFDQTIFGGGNEGDVTTDTLVNVDDSRIAQSIYGGGNAADVLGNTTLNVAGVTTVTDSVFGGGNSGDIGASDIVNPTSKTTVNILGATIGRNVYGGGNTSIVYGNTDVNIGASAPSTETLTRADVIINGTVFGGGESNAAGDEEYDFVYKSVTQGIEIDIDGTGYNREDFDLRGSVFGSGNASSSTMASNITIKHIGTFADPVVLVSIQRAATVSIFDSTIELTGTTDRTTIYNKLRYSLNRIEHFNIIDNTTLLLHQNANVLAEFNSLATVNGSLGKAAVTINNTGITTQNANNRLFMLANRNLNISINETANAYGTVTGMTFLGMFTIDENDNYVYGIYDMEHGDAATENDTIVGGSYVMGLHVNDSTIDGFYTNVLEEGATNLVTEYIVPTPPNSNYHMWAVGLKMINYNFTLTASKYASLGTHELSLIEFYHGNTIFEVLDFNAENIETGVTIIDPLEVPKIADTTAIANSTFGLTMKSETTEWTSLETTKYYSENDGELSGSTRYLSDSTNDPPILTFYLYHAKNITEDQEDLGTVYITLQTLTPTNEIEYEVSLATIMITLATATFTDTPAYDASINYGKKYEMPATTDVNITTTSSFTAYYSLYDTATSLSDFYGNSNNYYRSLTSNFALPEGTEITMIDMSVNETAPLYYSYKITSTDYTNALAELASENEATYRLNKFLVMGTTTSGNKYNDAAANQTYFRSNMILEEFLFIFDFQDTIISTDQLANSILLELRTSDDRTSISVLSARQPLMTYNLYLGSNVVLEGTGTTEDNYLYYGIDDRINYAVNVGYDLTDGNQSIVDTNYENNSMGINISLYDGSNTKVSSSLLVGTTITTAGSTYYASSDGVYRIKLADKVSNLSRLLNIHIGDSLPSGTYRFEISLFSSPDGAYASNGADHTATLNFILVGRNNAVSATINDISKVIDGNTGLNSEDSNEVTNTIIYSSVLANPNVRVSAYLRDKTTYNATTYTEIDLASICDNTFDLPSVYAFTRGSRYEYMAYRRPAATQTLTLLLKNSLPSGTYKFVYKLYDTDQLIDEDEDYIVVKKPIIAP